MYKHFEMVELGGKGKCVNCSKGIPKNAKALDFTSGSGIYTITAKLCMDCLASMLLQGVNSMELKRTFNGECDPVYTYEGKGPNSRG